MDLRLYFVAVSWVTATVSLSSAFAESSSLSEDGSLALSSVLTCSVVVALEFWSR